MADSRQEKLLFWSTVAQASSAVVGVVLGVIATTLSYCTLQVVNAYEEQDLSPYVEYYWDFRAGQFGFSNAGDGAAVIKTTKITTSVGTFVGSVENWDQPTAQEFSNKVVRAATNEWRMIETKIGEAEISSYRDIREANDLNTIFMPPTPGTILRTGQNSTIFSISGKDNDVVAKVRNFISSRPSRFLSVFDVGICYCSTSGKSCYTRFMNDITHKPIASCTRFGQSTSGG